MVSTPTTPPKPSPHPTHKFTPLLSFIRNQIDTKIIIIKKIKLKTNTNISEQDKTSGKKGRKFHIHNETYIYILMEKTHEKSENIVYKQNI